MAEDPTMAEATMQDGLTAPQAYSRPSVDPLGCFRFWGERYEGTMAIRNAVRETLKLHRQLRNRRARLELHDRLEPGGRAQAAQPDQEDRGAAGDHEAPDRL